MTNCNELPSEDAREAWSTNAGEPRKTVKTRLDEVRQTLDRCKITDPWRG